METTTPSPSLKHSEFKMGFGPFLEINPCQNCILPKNAEKPKAGNFGVSELYTSFEHSMVKIQFPLQTGGSSLGSDKVSQY